jgi:hypothetical protein
VDADTGAHKAGVTLLLNKKPEQGAVTVTDPALTGFEAAGLQRSGGIDAQNGKTQVRSFVVYHTPVTVAPVKDIRPPVAPKRQTPPPP